MIRCTNLLGIVLILEGLLTFIADCDPALQHGCLATMSTKFNHISISIPILESIAESNQPEQYQYNTKHWVHKGEINYHHHDKSKNITYSKLDLFNIGYSIKHDPRYKLLPSGVCQTIRKYWIAWRGKRGGKCIPKHIDLLNWLVNQDNLISITINEEHTYTHTNTVKCLLANIQSIKNKDAVLHELISDKDIDASCVTETWLSYSCNDKVWIQATDLNKNRLSMHTSNRGGKREGRVALKVQDNIKVKFIVDKNCRTFQYTNGCWPPLTVNSHIL